MKATQMENGLAMVEVVDERRGEVRREGG